MEEKKITYFGVTGVCPVRDVLSRLGDKWSILVLTTLKINGKLRFGEVQKTIGDISQRMLTVTLRSMEIDGIISRRIYAEVPPRVEYELTELGETLFPHVQALVNWTKQNMDTIMNRRNDCKK